MNDEFDALLKSILDRHCKYGLMTLDLTNDDDISILRGHLGAAHGLGMQQSAEIFERVQMGIK
ncbi:hypothetical protein [Paenibacillus brasilensis]|uniref:Uncharacterized protein n=1 Tax=Paenibacillus brasilensis TaxID=128574 RepID=A0ABU0KTN6_9BACL|nr:hypothetical protein [Paenibacillus brasilensis]MDQ0492800.1 hypothetical protein [Paenibacillus brasilensis]